VRGMRASPGFFTGLGVRVALGRTFAEDEFKEGAPAVALLGHGLWQERFGADPSIVGREIRATPENQNSAPVLIRIVGVLPPGFWFGRASQERPDLIVPLRSVARPYMVQLRRGVPVALAENRITEAARAVGSDFRPDWRGATLESVHERYVAELRPLLLGVTACASLVLVLVCINVAILILLRALRRQKEMAVRVALGAERRHLLRLLLAEATLISAVSLGLALALTALVVRRFAPLIETELGRPPPAGPAGIGVDLNVALMVGGVGVMIAFMMALVPLLAPGKGKLADALRRSGFGATDGPAMGRLRVILISSEIAGALVLLAAGGVMIRSVLNLVQTDLGFEPDKVVRAGVVLPSRYREPEMIARFYQQLAERVAQAHPAATVTSAFPPFYPTNKRPIEWDGGGEGRDLSIGVLPIGVNYFATQGIVLRQGRDFTSADSLEAEAVAIVSESLAHQLWPEAPALGRLIRTTGENPGDTPGAWRRVIAVVRDVRQTYEDNDQRDLYLPFLQTPTRFGNVQMRIDRSATLAPRQLAAMVAALDPYVRVSEPKRLTSEDRQFARARFMTLLLTTFAGFGTGIALLGLYGVTAYSVQQREREIAIRLAMGATRAAVVRMFIQQSGTTIAMGLALGVGGAFAVSRILASQVYGVGAFDGASLAIACGFLISTAVLAIWWPARRVVTVDLIRILKEE
jgi:putative ABC transport system permease protein